MKNSVFSFRDMEETGEKENKENRLHVIIMYICLLYVI